MKNIFKESKGFTLIELLVVIAIIGILASVVLVSLNTARQKARDSKRISDVRTLQQALTLYYDSVNEYPTQDPPADLSAAGIAGVLKAYIQGGKLPCDPSIATASCTGDGGQGYVYYSSASTTSEYHLGAAIESSTHAQLGNDADSNPGVPDFDGTDTIVDCGLAAATWGAACYDVTQ